MAKLSYKLSYYVFYVLVALILVVLGLFYFVGYNQMQGENLAPEHTSTLIYLMYFLFAVAVISALVAAIMQFASAMKENAKGALKSLLGFIVLIALLVITYSIGSADPVKMGDGTIYSNVTMLKITDMMIYSTYVLLGVAGVLTLLNLSGIFKR